MNFARSVKSIQSSQNKFQAPNIKFQTNTKFQIRISKQKIRRLCFSILIIRICLSFGYWVLVFHVILSPNWFSDFIWIPHLDPLLRKERKENCESENHSLVEYAIIFFFVRLAPDNHFRYKRQSDRRVNSFPFSRPRRWGGHPHG